MRSLNRVISELAMIGIGAKMLHFFGELPPHTNLSKEQFHIDSEKSGTISEWVSTSIGVPQSTSDARRFERRKRSREAATKKRRQAYFPNSADPGGMKQSEYDGTPRSGRALLLDTFLSL
jgi:hypothetical protein